MSESIADGLRSIAARMEETYPDPHGYPEEIRREADRAAELEASEREAQGQAEQAIANWQAEQERANELEQRNERQAVALKEELDCRVALEDELERLRPLAERGKRLTEAVTAPFPGEVLERVYAVLDAEREEKLATLDEEAGPDGQ